MAKLNLFKAIQNQEKNIEYPEQMIATGLLQPFNNSNSGSRKLMLATHLTHRLPLKNPEIPLVQTGFENEFGKHSSSFISLDDDYMVVARVNKFSNNPDHHYFLIIKNMRTDVYDIIERVSFKHITETYGYTIDNSVLDYVKLGEVFNKGTVIQKSTSYDEYNNHMDGVNLTTMYLSCNHTMEDAIIISESAAEKLTSQLIKKVTVIVNDNDILLNLYGNENEYKVLPDIGCEIKDGILCALRREKKEEALFSQSYDKLQDIFLSDDKFTVEGKVVDIDIYCNNREALQTSLYNSQLNYYHNDKLRFCENVVSVINTLDNPKMSYELEKLYVTSKRILDGDQYIKDRPFSNIILDIYVLEENKISTGDKLSDRYGGKGVVSLIKPDNEMPMLDNGTIVDIVFNMSTCVNRLNPGQLFETSLNHIASRIIDLMYTTILYPEECLQLYLKFLSIVNPQQEEFIIDNILGELDEEGIVDFLNSVILDEGIVMSLMPLSSNIDIDKMFEIYEELGFADQYRVMTPIVDSKGNTRFVQSRRKMVVGKKYIYRLKQYAEEKFSVTSLSATNIKNENSRSKANKAYKGLYTKTPIRFGEMETGDLSHLGMEYVVINLLLYSSSPHARRLAEELITGDPFNIDIRLDENSKSRNVEILNTYLKTMGLRLVFEKVKKNVVKPILVRPIKDSKTHVQKIKPILEIDKDLTDDLIKVLNKCVEEHGIGIIKPILTKPIIGVKK